MEIVSAVTQLGPLIEKGGVVALLVLMIVVVGWDWWRLRKELAKVYAQRDRALLGLVKCKTILESKQITVDLSDIRDLIPNGQGG